MSLKTLKVEKDLCRCCHAEGKFQKLSEPLLHLGRLEDYAQMMRSCLNVELSPVQGVLAASTYTICNECIQRLRDANNFRQQVFLCEERFKYMYCEFLNSEEVVKLELSSDDEVKVEFLQDDDDRLDIRFDNSDDEPVIQVKEEESKKTKTKPKPKSKPKSKKPAGVQNSSNSSKKGIRPWQKFVPNETDYTKGDSNTLICSKCSKIFKTKSALCLHLKTVHYKIPRFFCSNCEEIYGTKTQLVIHKLNQHDIDERVRCDECNSVFNTKRLLTRHREANHVARKKLNCNFCYFEAYFRNDSHRQLAENTLKYHVVKYHSNAEEVSDISL